MKFPNVGNSVEKTNTTHKNQSNEGEYSTEQQFDWDMFQKEDKNIGKYNNSFFRVNAKSIIFTLLIVLAFVLIVYFAGSYG